MQGELTVIGPDGLVCRRPLADPDAYEEIKDAVGGGLDLVPGFASFEGRTCDAYVNDQSSLNGMPQNRKATELWWPQLDESRRLGNALSILHGPLAIVTGDDEFIAASR